MQFVTLTAAVAGNVASFAFQGLSAIRDPSNADAVAAVGELSSFDALERMKGIMMADRTGRAILRQQPRVTDEILELARRQPEGTFGHRYAAFMDYNHFLPSGRAPVRHISDPTLAYVMERCRQCHDYLHTVTEAGRTIEEELAVKMLEWKHTGLPLGLLAVVGGSVKLSSAQRRHLPVYWQWAEEQTPRAVHGEKHVPSFLNVPWEEMLDKPMEEVRAVTGLIALPEYLERRGILPRH